MMTKARFSHALFSRSFVPSPLLHSPTRIYARLEPVLVYADVVFQSLLDHRDTAGGHDYVEGGSL